MRFRVRLLFIMLLRAVAARRLRVGKGLNKCENEGSSSVHDPSDEVSEPTDPESAAEAAAAAEAAKNGVSAPDAPMGATDLFINEANGFAAEAITVKK